jgi:phosphoribosylformylglycinamidine synthase
MLLKGTPAGLALTSDVNPVYCSLDPYQGGAQAVAEAVRNLACVGAEPVGLTDCLNFGNPELPEVSWQFRECIRGISDACRALAVPVVSGNVSFYNDTEGQSIHPTPTVAMVGLIPDLSNLPVAHFTTPGDRLVLLGTDSAEFGGSAYLRLLHGIEQGRPPGVELGAEERLTELMRLASFEGWLHTAHDISEGGLAIALAESCFAEGIGAKLKVNLTPHQLFSESQARAIVAVSPKKVEDLLREAEDSGVPAFEVGEVGGEKLEVVAEGGKISATVEELHQLWATALPRALEL